MKNEFEIGDRVLIFKETTLTQSADDINFKMGTVIERTECDISTHGSPCYVSIYKVLGDDEEIYTDGAYRFRTIERQMGYLRKSADEIDEEIAALKSKKKEIISAYNKVKKLNEGLLDIAPRESRDIRLDTLYEGREKMTISKLSRNRKKKQK